MILSDKSCTFDLYCTTETGEQMIVEMQYSSQESLRDRMLYYATYPIRSQLMERLKQTEEEEEKEKDKRKKMDYTLRPVRDQHPELQDGAREGGDAGGRDDQPVRFAERTERGADDGRCWSSWRSR